MHIPVLNKENPNKLVFDLETDSVDVSKANIVSFHGYSYMTNEYFNLMYKGNEQKIKNILDSHDIFITFNGDEFDIKIISRIYRKNYNYTKDIDLYKIILKRGGLMKYGGFRSNSLKNVAKELKLTQNKQENFDYELLKKESFTDEEILYIFEYGQQDILTTKELFEYIYNYFEFWKEYLPKRDILSWSWLMSSPGTYAYKVICHLSNIDEKWPTETINHDDYKFEGGFVSSPSVELEQGDIYCLDFNSAYPHAFMMMNLFGHKCKCCLEEDKYKGGSLFTLENSYCTKKLNPIGETIKKLYHQRMIYKQNKDERQFPLKIILNTMYGITSNPTFLSVFNLNMAKDCTHFCRECTKFARQKFESAGYDILYSDTDSIYLKDKYADEERLMMIKDSVIKQIQDSVQFPQDTFDLGIDERIKLIYFPKLKKKNYLYVSKEGKITIKGLPIMKRDSSKLSRYIFDTYLKNRIIDGQIRFDYYEIKDYIHKELSNDISLIAQQFKSRELKEYKSNTNLHYLISERYGPSTHYLIPNNVYGIGKSKKFCTIEEFKEKNILIEDIDLSKFWSEIEPFVNNFAFKKRKMRNSMNQQLLKRWATC